MRFKKPAWNKDKLALSPKTAWGIPHGILAKEKVYMTTQKKPKWMVLQAMFRTRKISAYQIKLAGVLLDFANFNSGECFPGDALLLKEVGFSDARELRRCLRLLESDGWLRIQMDSAGRRKIIFNWERAYVRPGKEAVEDTDAVEVADLGDAAESVWKQMPTVFPQNMNGHNWDKARPSLWSLFVMV
jgi:hypothetical protein